MGKGPKKIHEIVTHYLTHSGSRADVAEKLKKRTGSGSTTALSAWSRDERIPKSRDQIIALRKIVECQCPEYTDEAIKAAMPKTPQPAPKPRKSKHREARSVGRADREALDAVSRLSAAVMAEYDVVTRRATGDNDTQFFHQTFFEHAAARGVATRGRATIELLAQRVDDDPTDLFFGEVAAQVVLLAGRHSKVPVPLADEILAR